MRAARRVPLFGAGMKATEAQGQKLLETGGPLSSHREFFQGLGTGSQRALSAGSLCQALKELGDRFAHWCLLVSRISVEGSKTSQDMTFFRPQRGLHPWSRSARRGT